MSFCWRIWGTENSAPQKLEFKLRRKIKNSILYFIGVIMVSYVFSQIGTNLFNIKGAPYSNKYIVLTYLNDWDIARNFVALILIIIGIVTLRVIFDPKRTDNVEYIGDFSKKFIEEIKKVGFTSKIRLSMLFFVVAIFLFLMIIPSFISVVISDKYLILNLVFFLAPITLAEEIIFRYGIFKYLRQMHVNAIIPYVLSAIIFGSEHFYKNNGFSPISSFIWTSAFAFLLQMVYEGSGWSIYPSWFLHLLNDVSAILINIPRK